MFKSKNSDNFPVAGSAARDSGRLLAPGLGAEELHHRDADQAGGEGPGQVRSGQENVRYEVLIVGNLGLN